MHIRLSVAGSHNISNALACIALCSYYGIGKNFIYSALIKFTGASRRMEFVGSYHGVSVYDDYGHHPTEISATAKAIADKDFKESWVIFQPHTYSRTKMLLDDFARSLLPFDHIIVTDIYAAREQNNYNISSIDLVNKIKEYRKEAIYIKNFDDIVSYIKSNAKANDLCFLYLNTHGTTQETIVHESWGDGTEREYTDYINGGIATANGPYEYVDVINFLTSNIKGKIIFMPEVCFSGGFVTAARNSAAGVDSHRSTHYRTDRDGSSRDGACSDRTAVNCGAHTSGDHHRARGDRGVHPQSGSGRLCGQSARSDGLCAADDPQNRQ